MPKLPLRKVTFDIRAAAKSSGGTANNSAAKIQQFKFLFNNSDDFSLILCIIAKE